MRDCEQQTDQYSDLYCHGNRLAARYKPSDTLDAMMSSLHDRWVGYVGQLGERCEELLGIQELWTKYEKEVKELLNWIMAEAEKFSSEVTTQGDKGIEDHITSCKVGKYGCLCLFLCTVYVCRGMVCGCSVCVCVCVCVRVCVCVCV